MTAQLNRLIRRSRSVGRHQLVELCEIQATQTNDQRCSSPSRYCGLTSLARRCAVPVMHALLSQRTRILWREDVLSRKLSRISLECVDKKVGCTHSLHSSLFTPLSHSPSLRNPDKGSGERYISSSSRSGAEPGRQKHFELKRTLFRINLQECLFKRHRKFVGWLL